MSPSGKHVYFSWNGPSGGDLYVGISHDFGETWTQKKLSDGKRYYYAYDARALRDGTVDLLGVQHRATPAEGRRGRVWHHAVVSRDKGAPGRTSSSRRCPSARAASQTGAAPTSTWARPPSFATAPGHLVFAYEGPATAGGPSRSTSRPPRTAAGRGAPACHSPVAGENATGPRLASSGGGNVRIWYMQTTGHDPDAWNVWYRSSADGGANWSPPVQISDAPAGAAGLRQRERLRRDLRRLRRDRDHERRARRSPPGARASATRARAAPGSTSSVANGRSFQVFTQGLVDACRDS